MILYSWKISRNHAIIMAEFIQWVQGHTSNDQFLAELCNLKSEFVILNSMLKSILNSVMNCWARKYAGQGLWGTGIDGWLFFPPVEKANCKCFNCNYFIQELRYMCWWSGTYEHEEGLLTGLLALANTGGLSFLVRINNHFLFFWSNFNFQILAKCNGKFGRSDFAVWPASA